MSCSPTRVLKTLCVVAAWGLMAGCSTLSPYSTLTKVNLTLQASDQLNPDLNGRPSPVVVSLFELKHPVRFENVDFFSRYAHPK